VEEKVLGGNEAAQQSKISQKRKVDSALNSKRSKIFNAKSNCGTASNKRKNENKNNSIGRISTLYNAADVSGAC
jgi:hypothetical protein